MGAWIMSLGWENDFVEASCGHDGSRIHIRLAIEPDMDQDEFEGILSESLKALRNHALAEHRRLSIDVRMERNA